MNVFEVKILSALRSKTKAPLSPKEILKKIGVKKGKREQFFQALATLVEQNKILESGGRYILADTAGLAEAEIVKVNATFGFARITGQDKDVFIPGRRLLGAMPGDKVLLRRKRSQGQLPEGEVVKISKPAYTRFSGVVRLLDQEFVVIPDNYVKFPLSIHRSRMLGALDGDKVIARLIRRGDGHADHLVEVLERFGDSDSAAACCRAILSANDIYPPFPPEVMEQAAALSALSGIHPKELAQRMDLREECIFTIDGADSKDLDDAVSIQKLDNGWKLGVHIADVSYFVTHQSPLDLEAFQRGTSVYYADSVVPMLPPELSNGICSLNPQEDRLTFSALMTLDQDGNLTGYRFEKTVICSLLKGVYSEVNAVLGGTATSEILQKYAQVTDTLHLMQELAAILTKKRYAQGSLHLESVESKITVGADGKAVGVAAREQGISQQIIEEFMLTANQAAAKLALEKGLPFLYRIHEHPALDRLEMLYETLDRLGIPVKRLNKNVSSAQLSAILDKVANTAFAPVVNVMMLRSMAKAKYSEQNVGHFGLAMADYTHFTSPIRRYPDLTIHRILSGYVTGMKMDNIRKRYNAFTAAAAAHSTQREIVAMTAERNCEDCYKAEYMARFVGEEFDGIITGTTSFGIYVQLENTVEGLVAVAQLPGGNWGYDSYVAMVDHLSGKRLQLGDAVRIKVLSVKVALGQIDFGFVQQLKK